MGSAEPRLCVGGRDVRWASTSNVRDSLRANRYIRYIRILPEILAKAPSDGLSSVIPSTIRLTATGGTKQTRAPEARSGRVRRPRMLVLHVSESQNQCVPKTSECGLPEFKTGVQDNIEILSSTWIGKSSGLDEATRVRP